MASSGFNLAVTKDGGAYNKLQRPDDYLLPTTVSHLPPLGAVVPPTAYSGKRKRGQDAAPGSKRARADASFARTIAGATVKECGMRPMLPGGNEDEQLSDDSTNEALAYLRGVRSEASMIPSLLVAPASDNGGEGHDVHSPYIDASDTSGSMYYDGIWIGLDEENGATHEEDGWDENNGNLDAQEACYKLLLSRFQALREQILEAKTSSSKQNVLAVSEDSSSIQIPRSKRAWLQTIDRDQPNLCQILRLDERALYLGLQSCASSLSQSTTISREKCSWIWSLMASTGDIGILDHERIGKIRDLGLQAGRLGLRLRDNSDGPSKIDENTSAGDLGSREEVFGRQNGDGDDVRHGGSLKGATSESEAEMSMSENEDQVHDKADTKDLEQARARLLAQLGDRLVQPQVPSSRAEAERQRQQMQGQEPGKGCVQSMHNHNGASHQLDSGSLALAEADWNTKVAIDMILTVAAECYGQRDLLSFRQTW
ncbi:Nn.00g037970.m01.CDS01 [Neocucurbitaria sp. VM-36]